MAPKYGHGLGDTVDLAAEAATNCAPIKCSRADEMSSNFAVRSKREEHRLGARMANKAIVAFRSGYRPTGLIGACSIGDIW